LWIARKLTCQQESAKFAQSQITNFRVVFIPPESVERVGEKTGALQGAELRSRA
jgi:hypothetical protein